MLHNVRFYSSKSKAFWVKYLGSDYCKIYQLACPKFLKWLLTLEKYNNKQNYISDTKITIFHDLFNRFTLICFF